MTIPALAQAAAAGGAVGTATMFAQVDFKGTITLGSILLGVLVTAIAGLYTIRARIAGTWKTEAEGRGARIETLKIELQESELSLKEAEKRHTQDIAALEREQQEVRHALKDELAGCKAALKVEEAKHDLSALMERMQLFHSEAMSAMQVSTGSAVEAMAASLADIGRKLDKNQERIMQGQDDQRDLLGEIRDALRPSD